MTSQPKRVYKDYDLFTSWARLSDMGESVDQDELDDDLSSISSGPLVILPPLPKFINGRIVLPSQPNTKPDEEKLIPWEVRNNDDSNAIDSDEEPSSRAKTGLKRKRLVFSLPRVDQSQPRRRYKDENESEKDKTSEKKYNYNYFYFIQHNLYIAASIFQIKSKKQLLIQLLK